MVITTMRIVLRLAPLLLLLAGCAETWTCPEGEGRRARAEGGFEDDCVPLGDMDAGTDGGDEADAGACAETCSADTPVCDVTTGDCVQCNADDDSFCDGPGESCDLNTNRCIECDTDSDCTLANAARCGDDGRCTGCTGNEECGSVMGDFGVCETGNCVQCTVMQPGACATGICTIDNICSMFDGTRRSCESCDTDENCTEAGTFCVPMMLGMDMRPGGYCLPEFTGACPPPFIYETAAPRRTLSGDDTRRICTLDEMVTACEPVRLLLDNEPLSPCMNDSECGPTGLCRQVGSLVGKCTYRCAGPQECPNDPPGINPCGNERNMMTGVEYCGGGT